MYYLKRASEGTLSRWFRLHLQSLALGSRGLCPDLCVIHKKDLCPSSGDINRLMMMMMYIIPELYKHLCA
jgi:hypothetical protein